MQVHWWLVKEFNVAYCYSTDWNWLSSGMLSIVMQVLPKLLDFLAGLAIYQHAVIYYLSTQSVDIICMPGFKPIPYRHQHKNTRELFTQLANNLNQTYRSTWIHYCSRITKLVKQLYSMVCMGILCEHVLPVYPKAHRHRGDLVLEHTPPL